VSRTDFVLIDDDSAGGLGLLDGLPAGQRAYVSERQRILDGQILQHPVRRGGQRCDKLLDPGGQPCVVMAGRLHIDAGQQVVAPQRGYLVGHWPSAVTVTMSVAAPLTAS
jgi:hypothetical protein